MSLDLYDKALYKKIHELFPNVVNSSEDDAFKNSINNDVPTKEKDREDPSVVFPLISFWRTGNPPNLEEDGNYPTILRGRQRKNIEAMTSDMMRTFPVKISYQITIWSDKRVQVDDIYREFVMLFFVDEPYIRVQVDDTNTEDFSLILVDSEFNADTTSFSDRGRVYRQDIMIELPSAKLFYRYDGPKLIGPEVEPPDITING